MRKLIFALWWFLSASVNSHSRDWANDARVEWIVATDDVYSIAGKGAVVVQLGSLRDSGFAPLGNLILVIRKEGAALTEVTVLTQSKLDWPSVIKVGSIDLARKERVAMKHFLLGMIGELVRPVFRTAPDLPVGGTIERQPSVFAVEAVCSKGFFRYCSNMDYGVEKGLSDRALGQLNAWATAYGNGRRNDTNLPPGFRLIDLK
jgi:hypothetical protein